MDDLDTVQSEPFGDSLVQVVVLSSAAALAAAVVGLAAYAYVRRRLDNSPEGRLRHCRTAIDQLRRSLDMANA